MKRILILRDKIPFSGREAIFEDFLRKHFKNKAEIKTERLTRVMIEMRPTKIKISFGEKDVRDYDLIWIRKPTTKFVNLAAALGLCFDFLGVKYFDTSFGKRAVGGNKLLLLLNLAKNGLPIPQSFFLFREELPGYRQKIINQLGFPLVAKLMGVHWGKGVFVLRNEEEFNQFVKSRKKGQLVFQRFHPHQGDYRILVLGYQVWAWEKMWRESDLAPQSVGGMHPVGDLKKKEFYPVSKIPPKMAKLAIKAARAVSLEVAGVDILKDSHTGKYIMTEVNRTPAFATDYPGDPELKAVAYFLEKSLGL